MGGKNPVIALVERTHNVMEKEWVTSDEMDETDHQIRSDQSLSRV